MFNRLTVLRRWVWVPATLFGALFVLASGDALRAADAATARAARPPQESSPAVVPETETLRLTVDRAVPVPLDRPAASVFIANPEIADVQVLSPTTVMVFGKKTGHTTLVVGDSSGAPFLHRTVAVTQNLADLESALRTALPGQKIRLESVPNGIVMTGEVRDSGMVDDARRMALRYLPKEGGEIINRMRVKGSNQIHIRVRFAEVARDVDKRFGINWESIGNVGGFAFGLASGAPVISAGANLLDRARPTTGSSANNIISMTHQGSDHNVNGLIDALAKDGFVTLLAEPNLTAMSGETASFLAGGEFPIPVPQSLNTTTIEWKNYGVSLAFTPTLIGEDRINLHVRPEVSQLTDVGAVTLNGIVVPALTTRRAETTIELASGQSFAIGGLLNNNQTQSLSKYPFLGDMPILGSLFRSTRFQNNETELVIVITPYIVRPVEEELLSLPTDGFAPPSDVDLILRHRQSAASPDGVPLSGPPRVMPPPAPVTSGMVRDAVPQAAPLPAVEPVPMTALEPPPAPAPAPETEPRQAAAPNSSPPPLAAPVTVAETPAMSVPSPPPPAKPVAVARKAKAGGAAIVPVRAKTAPRSAVAAPAGAGGFIVE